VWFWFRSSLDEPAAQTKRTSEPPHGRYVFHDSNSARHNPKFEAAMQARNCVLRLQVSLPQICGACHSKSDIDWFWQAGVTS
jgi:hypothetical protein